MSEDQLLDSTILFTHKKGVHGGNGPMTEPIIPKLKLIWNWWRYLFRICLLNGDNRFYNVNNCVFKNEKEPALLQNGFVQFSVNFGDFVPVLGGIANCPKFFSTLFVFTTDNLI